MLDNKAFKLFTFLILLSVPLVSFASHNRAGEITYVQIDDFTIEATITTYTKTSSIPADRDSLEINWGDGSIEWLVRTNGTDTNGDNIPDGELLGYDITFNEYRKQHTYSEYDNYTISMEDPNRNGQILNINSSNSDQIAFYIETEFTLSSEMNHSPELLERPIDLGMAGAPFMHIVNAFDIDGDSISYQLISPQMSGNTSVTNYVSVTEIVSGANNNLTLNEETGLLIWDAPQALGEYSIAIEIATYRNGIMNGRVVRDMQILILNEAGELPLISIGNIPNGEFIDVNVGDSIELLINSELSDMTQTLRLSSSSGLYDFYNSTPEFIFDDQDNHTGTATFKWRVESEHVRTEPHTIVFKSKNDLGAANFFVIRYRVVDISNFISDIEEMKLLIFPNPSNNRIKVLTNDILKTRDYQILDINGKLIRSGELDSNNEIDILDIAKGIYLLRLNNNFTKKIIKN